MREAVQLTGIGEAELVLGEGPAARTLIRDLRRRMRRENQRIVSAVLTRRHRLATTRLLESTLSPGRRVWPRARLEDVAV